MMLPSEGDTLDNATRLLTMPPTVDRRAVQERGVRTPPKAMSHTSSGATEILPSPLN